MSRVSDGQAPWCRWRLGALAPDPFRRPARFAIKPVGVLARLLAREDQVTIGRRSVLIVRHAGPVRLSITRLPIARFRGVSVHIAPTQGPSQFRIAVGLMAGGEAPALPLFTAEDLQDATARWQAWGRVLGLPLLLPTLDGGWRDCVPRLGRLVIKPPEARRARHVGGWRWPRRRKLRPEIQRAG